MKGNVLLEVVMVVRRQTPQRGRDRTEVEEVTLRHVESTVEEDKQFSYEQMGGRLWVSEPSSGKFTLTLVDPDLFGTFKVGSIVDLALGLRSPENT